MYSGKQNDQRGRQECILGGNSLTDEKGDGTIEDMVKVRIVRVHGRGSRRRFYIPKDIINELGLVPGDKLLCREIGNGAISIEKEAGELVKLGYTGKVFYLSIPLNPRMSKKCRVRLATAGKKLVARFI
jgi:bifunctional DNA-binding transcriptional regulator/antitoxin component of YhaV-PrlF toxin-antitoxin module